jgi:hypothetical protein
MAKDEQVSVAPVHACSGQFFLQGEKAACPLPRTLKKIPGKSLLVFSAADPDPGSGAFLPQGSGSGIRNYFFLDPGSRIPDSYDVPKSIYLQGFTFKNGKKQEKLNFV